MTDLHAELVAAVEELVTAVEATAKD